MTPISFSGSIGYNSYFPVSATAGNNDTSAVVRNPAASRVNRRGENPRRQNVKPAAIVNIRMVLMKMFPSRLLPISARRLLQL